MRLVGFDAQPAVPVGFVVLIVAFEPDHTAVAFERKHVRGDAIEEPAIVADDDGAAGEGQQGLFERAQRIHVEVVGGLVEKQQVRARLQQLRQVKAVAFTARQLADLPLLIAALEIEPGHIRARGDLALSRARPRRDRRRSPPTPISRH